MKKTLAAAAILLSAQHSLFAQRIQTNTIDSVTIQGNRIQMPYGKQNRDIQIITAEQVKAMPVKSINELLSYVSGVDIRQRGVSGTQADVSIDGSTFDEVLVLVNGVKMSDPQTGHHLMNVPIPLMAIDHIEILRGPAAGIYGVNALAGAINIVTRVPKENDVIAQVYSGSNFQTDSATGKTYYGWGAQASAALGNEKQSHVLSVAHDESNGCRYNTGYNAYRLFYQNHIAVSSKSNIDAMGGYVSNDFGANGYYAAPVDINSTENVQTVLGSVKYSYQLSPRVTISPRLSYRYNKDNYIFIKQSPEVYHNVHETNVLTGEVQSSIKLKNGNAGIGIEYRKEDIHSTNLGKRERNNIGIYAECKYNFTQHLNAAINLYSNSNSDFGWQLLPSADIGYTFLRHWKVFANASEGERLPTYTDLYYVGPTNIGNANLKPEHASYAEAGLQYKTYSTTLEAAYFYRHVTDFIDWVRASSLDPWQPRNFQSINTKGLTLRANYSLGRDLQLPKGYTIDLNASYTYLDQQIEASKEQISKYAIEALRHQAVLSVNTVLFNHLLINFAGRYQYRISNNDYTILDARVGYKSKWWELYADVNNILDAQYKEIGTVPMPGRWFTIGARISTAWTK